jgi:dienelactone hydrolase
MTKCRYSKLIISLLLIIPCSLAQFVAKGAAEEAVTLTTADGKQLKCEYFQPPMPNAPGVILLPDTRCDGKSFASIPKKLNEAGFAVLAMDLRYKDLIAKIRNRKEQISTIQKQDLMALVTYDAKSGIDFLSSRKEIDPKRIALIGTSLGSRVAIIAGVDYDLKALVLISLSGDEAFPGHKSIKQLLSDYGEKPILFMTAKRDWGGNGKAAEYNAQYYNWKNGKKELKIWPGSGHGVEILGKNDAVEFAANWLKSNL